MGAALGAAEAGIFSNPPLCYDINMEWVRVETCDLAEAEVVKNMLDSYGIPTRLSYDHTTRIVGYIGEGGLTTIQVPKSRVKEARAILEARPTQE